MKRIPKGMRPRARLALLIAVASALGLIFAPSSSAAFSHGGNETQKSGDYPFSQQRLREASPLYSSCKQGTTGNNPDKGILVIQSMTSKANLDWTFNEVGLAPGDLFSITLNGTRMSTTTGTIVFQLSSGTYPFTVGVVTGYTGSPMSGNVTPIGTPSHDTTWIDFAPIRGAANTVTFDEVGLRVSTPWSVTLNGYSETTANSTLTFVEPNGSYLFDIGWIPGFISTPSAGYALSSHVPLEVAVVFEPGGPYTVTFAERGLPSGTSWSVTLLGINKISMNSTVFFGDMFGNGTYQYTFGAVQGYIPVPNSGEVTISWSPANVSVQFDAIASHPAQISFGLSIFFWYGLAGGICLGASTTAGYFLLRARRKPPEAR